MGFTTGFLGGVTLTYSILYLSLYLHKANRNVQHTILSQQSALLNSLVEPLPPLPDLPAYEVKKDGLTETLKDRWNGEVESIVRRVQNTDWDQVRQRWERRIGNVWEGVRESDAGKDAESKLKELKDNVTGATQDAKEAAKSATKPETGTRLLELK